MPNALYEKILKLSDIDGEEIEEELKRIVALAGSTPENVTEEDMRTGLLKYLDSVSYHVHSQENSKVINFLDRTSH